jgi:hypothetical protein
MTYLELAWDAILGNFGCRNISFFTSSALPVFRQAARTGQGDRQGGNMLPNIIFNVVLKPVDIKIYI